MKIDVLAFGPHPDDVELFAGGTIAKLVELGYSAGMIDLTRGELGSRGTADDRDEEASSAAAKLGVSLRENLGLPDGGLNSRDYNQRHKIIECLRKHMPSMVFCPAAKDRHPDHKQGMELIEEAVFLANVAKYPSELPRHKVNAVVKYPMWWHPEADFIVDVSEFWDQRMEALAAYKTQFYTKGAEIEGPKTFLSQSKFIDWVNGRGAQFGAIIGVAYGEPFLIRTPVPVDDPFALLVNGAGEANP